MYYNEELNQQASEVFKFFAGSAQHMGESHFRKLFLATGEEIVENDFKDLFAEVDDDRDGRISLEEFTNWFKKDDSYEYGGRNKALRDIKERLKNPAVYRSLQYFMGRNPGTNANNMNDKSTVMDVDLGFKIGGQQETEFGFDLIYSKKQQSGSALTVELTIEDGVPFAEVENKLQQILAMPVAMMVQMGGSASDLLTPITIEGKPGVRIHVELPTMHPVMMIVPMFLSLIQAFHLKLHLSQRIFDNVQAQTLLVDAGIKFQAQRSAFQTIPYEAVAAFITKRDVWSLLSLLNHVDLSFGFDQFGQIADSTLGQAINNETMTKLKKELGRKIGGLLAHGENAAMFPLQLRNLHRIELSISTHVFTFTGINFDINFMLQGRENAPADYNHIPYQGFDDHPRDESYTHEYSTI